MDDSLTLRQGLEKFHNTYTAHLSHHKEGISAEAQSFFRSHDIAHVIFACDISLFGEGAVKIWTIFGTSLGFWKHISAYQKANALELSRDLPVTHFIYNLFTFLSAIPTLIIRAKRMHKPWPWFAYEPYLDLPLSDIRKEFNIQVLR